LYGLRIGRRSGLPIDVDEDLAAKHRVGRKRLEVALHRERQEGDPSPFGCHMTATRKGANREPDHDARDYRK